MDNEQLNTSGLREELNNNMRHILLPVIIFIGVEQFFGFFGNILVLTVYSARYKRTNFRYFVLVMASIDLTSCCTTLPGEMFSYSNWYNYQYDWICKLKSFFNVFTALGSAAVLLILAVDRYRKICRPLRKQIQPSYALKLCVCALILSFLVSIPDAILWGKQEYIDEQNGYNITVSICETAEEYAETIYPLVYLSIVYFLPVTSMIFVAGTLNLLTARTLFGMKSVNAKAAEMTQRPSIASTTLTSVSSMSDDFSTRKEQQGASSADRTGGKGVGLNHGKVTQPENNRNKRATRPGFFRKRKTIIMLVLTSVFLVTMTIYVILVGLVAQPENFLREMSNPTKAAYFFFLRLYYINCVVNPILYGFMDPRFRSGLLSYFHGKHRDK